MTATTLTHRPAASDARTRLRRMVADCILEAAETNTTSMVDWLASVDRLHNAVARLERLRTQGAPHGERIAASDEASLALMRVISVYEDAQTRLEIRLSAEQDLLDVRADIASGSRDLMDPVLHGSLAHRVCAVIEAQSPQVVTI